MKSAFKLWAVVLGFLTTAGQLAIAENTLKIGDPAPKLDVGKWVQGGPVTELEKGKAYIVEFWATWCGPCRTSIPHVNELYKKFKDKGLVVIGQDCWERDESLVEPFIKKMGDSMTYLVPLDNKTKEEKGAMAVTWMEAAGRNGIPSAFLVDTKGIIAWIGHPMELKENTIEEVLAGKFDIKKAADDAAKAEAAQGKLKKLSTELRQAMQAKKWDEALGKVDEMEKEVPEENPLSMQFTRFNILLMKKDTAAAYKLAGTLSEAHQDTPLLQNALAWTIINDKENTKPDLDLAAKIVETGLKGSENKNANILDTAARVYFMKGNKDKAVELAQKAVDVSEADGKERFQKNLEQFKNGELPKAQ